MKNGRINERNTGNYSLNSNLKGRRTKKTNDSILTSEQKESQNTINKIDCLISSFKSNYYSYLTFDLTDEQIKHWFENGIVVKGIKKGNPKIFSEDKEICLLVDGKLSDLELTKGLLKSFFKL